MYTNSLKNKIFYNSREPRGFSANRVGFPRTAGGLIQSFILKAADRAGYPRTAGHLIQSFFLKAADRREFPRTAGCLIQSFILKAADRAEYPRTADMPRPSCRKEEVTRNKKIYQAIFVERIKVNGIKDILKIFIINPIHYYIYCLKMNNRFCLVLSSQGEFSTTQSKKPRKSVTRRLPG